MALIPILLPPGLDRNGTPYDSKGTFWDMNLFRWVSGSARPIGGWQRKTASPLGSPIRRFHTWKKNDNSTGTIAATEQKLYLDYQGGWTDITPTGIVPPIITFAGGYGTGPYGRYNYGRARPVGVSVAFAPPFALWSFTNWGEDVLFLSSLDNRVFHYVASTPTTLPLPIPNSTTPGAPPVPLANAVGVTDERHVMLVGPTIGGTYYPRRVCWSSRETLDDWDFASITNTAGFLDLTTNSPLNFIMKVREGMLIFSSTEVFLAQYVGMPYVYGITKIGEGQFFHPYSFAPFDGTKVMWLATRGVRWYESGAVRYIDCPIFNDIKDDFSLTWAPYRTHASANGNFPEVWTFWPSESATECDRYVIFNWNEGWWGWGYLHRSAMISSGPTRYPLAGSSDGTIYEHENGWTDAGHDIKDQRWLESGALGIQNGDAVVDVKQAMLASMDNFHDYPQSVKIQFYGRYTPDGAERVFGPYTPRLDGYTDVRVNCREARIRFVGAVDRLFDVGLLRLDISTGGRR